MRDDGSIVSACQFGRIKGYAAEFRFRLCSSEMVDHAHKYLSINTEDTWREFIVKQAMMLDSNVNAALVGVLVGQLRESGNWCGETHLQKAVYFLQTARRVPMGYSFDTLQAWSFFV